MEEAGQYKQEDLTYLCIYPMLLLVYLCETDCKIDPHVCLAQEHVPLNSLKGIKYTKQVWVVCLSWEVGKLLLFFSSFCFFVFFLFLFSELD